MCLKFLSTPHQNFLDPPLQRHRASIKATFAVSSRIAKAKKPHTIAEQLILQCARDINRILFGKEAESGLNVLSLSDNTVQRRISLMSDDIKNQVIDQMKSAGSFALQVNESTDVSSCAQLIAFVRYVHNGTEKYHTVGSLNCDACPHFLRAKQTFGVKLTS